MRNTYHLCLSSHKEIMYRDEEDLVMGFNSLALAVFNTDSRLLAESFITTHNHKAVQTDNYRELVRRERYTYCRYFNAKYYRRGGIGERNPFCLVVNGLYHTTALLDYVIRQGLHHGLATTPFDYPHCSANSFFRKELGKDTSPSILAKKSHYLHLPEHVHLPKGFAMASNGLILREKAIDTAYVQEIYISPRNYIYRMNRINDDDIIQNQVDEGGPAPITLEAIEKGVNKKEISTLLSKQSPYVNNTFLTDLEMCKLIDKVILPRIFKDNEHCSVYLLSDRKRAEIGNNLLLESSNMFGKKGSSIFCFKKTTPAQIKRCLIL